MLYYGHSCLTPRKSIPLHSWEKTASCCGQETTSVRGMGSGGMAFCIHPKTMAKRLHPSQPLQMANISFLGILMARSAYGMRDIFVRGEHDHIVRDRSEHPISRDDDDAVPGSSLSCFGDESIMDGGWILHSPDALMFWVPPWCRTGLICGKTNETGFDSFFTWGILASVPGITYLRRAPCTIFQFYFP